MVKILSSPSAAQKRLWAKCKSHEMVNSTTSYRLNCPLKKSTKFLKKPKGIGGWHKIGNSRLEIMGLKRELEHFLTLMEKHIDLVDRMLLNVETIPTEEKMFSIIETLSDNPGRIVARPIRFSTIFF